MFIKLGVLDFHHASLTKALLLNSEDIVKVIKEVDHDYYLLECKDGKCYYLSREGFDHLSKVLTKED